MTTCFWPGRVSLACDNLSHAKERDAQGREPGIGSTQSSKREQAPPRSVTTTRIPLRLFGTTPLEEREPRRGSFNPGHPLHYSL